MPFSRFTKVRPLHVFLAGLVAFTFSGVLAGVFLGKDAAAILLAEAPLAIGWMGMVSLVARSQRELLAQQREASDARRQWWTEEIARSEELDREPALQRAVLAAGRTLNNTVVIDPNDVASLELIPGLLAKEASSGHILRTMLMALIEEARVDGAPTAWVSTIRLDQALVNSARPPTPGLSDAAVRASRVRSAIAQVLSPAGYPVSAEMIAHWANEFIAGGALEPRITAEEVTHQMTTWERSVPAGNDLWKIQ